MAVIDTPAGISRFRLVSLRGMLRLESIGMKTRGGALRPRLAKEFGLSARAPHKEFISAIDKKLEETP